MEVTYPDIEAMLVAWLSDRLGVLVSTDTDDELEAELPVVTVIRIGGTDNYNIDRPSVVVDCYGHTRAEAQDLANEIRAALRWELPNAVVPGGVVSRVNTISAPASRPYANNKAHRFNATYQLIVRSQ